jgi:Secretion system C-terminal sorting domain
MKKPLLFFFACGVWQLSSGQCLTNGDFTSSNFASCVSPVEIFECGTFNECNNWYRLQGTPQIVNYDIQSNGNTVVQYYAYMWAGANVGEGMFTPYTFQANHSYDVKVIFTAYDGPGTFTVDAANGLTTPSAIDCNGDAPPSSADAANIGIYSGPNGNMLSYQASFTAGKNYSQLWIYPSAPGIGINEYEMQIYDVYACPSCTALLTYSSGTLPTGESAAGTIRAGGSGTVSNAAGLATTFSAAKEIDLLPSFQASAASGATFVAQIVPCANTIPADIPNNLFNANPPPRINPDKQSPAVPQDQPVSTGLQIYPTISPGTFTITGASADLANAYILVTDESGRSVYRLYNGAGNTTVKLNLSPLGSGLYFVQINNGSKTTTQKIIIQK